VAEKFKIKLDYIVYAEPMQVFEALTDTGIIGAWGGGISIVEPTVGGLFEYFDGWVKGEVLAYDHGKFLSFTWSPEEWPKRTKPSKVEIRFVKNPAGTALVIEHSDFPSQEEATKHENGWIDFVLDPMNDYFTLLKEEAEINPK
jgi:hypothetical protein